MGGFNWFVWEYLEYSTLPTSTRVFLLARSYLGGETSNIFGIFTPILGEDSHFDEHIFSNGLKPQTNN